MDDQKCAKKTHLSITETSDIFNFMLVALTYCKVMSSRCQLSWRSYKQISLHTKLFCNNLSLSLSQCMHSYLWILFALYLSLAPCMWIESTFDHQLYVHVKLKYSWSPPIFLLPSILIGSIKSDITNLIMNHWRYLSFTVLISEGGTYWLNWWGRKPIPSISQIGHHDCHFFNQ